MKETLEDIIERIDEEQYGFLTVGDISQLIGITHGKVDFNVLVRRNQGRDIVNVIDYFSWQRKFNKAEHEHDWIRDISVNFSVGGRKDMSWEIFKGSVLGIL